VASRDLPDVGGIITAVRTGVQRRLGRRRKLYTADDLIDDVGLSTDQFEDLVSELEGQFGVVIDPETAENLTVAGALVARLVSLCSREAVEDESERAVA
jgi:acyl carrier protein